MSTSALLKEPSCNCCRRGPEADAPPAVIVTRRVLATAGSGFAPTPTCGRGEQIMTGSEVAVLVGLGIIVRVGVRNGVAVAEGPAVGMRVGVAGRAVAVGPPAPALSTNSVIEYGASV
jgi:hypothetical protein